MREISLASGCQYWAPMSLYYAVAEMCGVHAPKKLSADLLRLARLSICGCALTSELSQ
jgi:hypothetical protein